jgi:predicted membrane channel-forming protein YqfA (hemolysin III family)
MMSYRARRRWSLLILLVGLPLYIAAAVTAMNWLDVRFGRQPIWIEVLIYVVLGMVFFLPFRRVFRGIGQADPDDTPPR